MLIQSFKTDFIAAKSGQDICLCAPMLYYYDGLTGSTAEMRAEKTRISKVLNVMEKYSKYENSIRNPPVKSLNEHKLTFIIKSYCSLISEIVTTSPCLSTEH